MAVGSVIEFITKNAFEIVDTLVMNWQTLLFTNLLVVLDGVASSV